MSQSHYRALLSLGLPIVIGQIGVIVLGFADTLMIGHHSTTELAAASFVNNMFNLAIIFSTGFAYGLTPVVGSLFGQHKVSEVGRTLKNSLAANTVLAAIVCLVMTILYLNLDRMGHTAYASLLYGIAGFSAIRIMVQRIQTVLRWNYRYQSIHVDIIKW